MATAPDYRPLPKDRCTLTMLTGPTPGAVHVVGQAGTTMGRAPELSWCIGDRGVSSEHACITRKEGGFWLEDLNSTNGTFVNGRRVETRQRLCDGDHVQLGEHTLLRVSLHDANEQEATERLYRAAVLDPLTGVYNRGHLEAVLVAEYAFATRHRSPLGVAFADLDHFSSVNNTHGHQAGDAVLQQVANTMRRAVRTEDLVARYGGEEFVILARGIDLNGTMAMAERVRRMVEVLQVPVAAGVVRVTASFGVAAFERATPYGSVGELLAAADRAVYRAKAAGRNRVCEAADTCPASWRA